MALIFFIDHFPVIDQHQFGRGGADIDAQGQRMIQFRCIENLHILLSLGFPSVGRCQILPHQLIIHNIIVRRLSECNGKTMNKSTLYQSFANTQSMPGGRNLGIGNEE